MNLRLQCMILALVKPPHIQPDKKNADPGTNKNDKNSEKNSLAGCQQGSPCDP